MSTTTHQGAAGAETMKVEQSLDLRDLHAANIARQAEWCPDQVPDLSFRGNELGGECGEAQNVIKKLERERQGWRGSRATKDDLADELADVVICADLCAVTADIDLGAAVRRKFNATSEKQGLSVFLPAPALRSDGGMTAGEDANFGDAPHDLVSEIATQVLNLPWTRLGLTDPRSGHFDHDALADRHGDVQIIAEKALRDARASDAESAWPFERTRAYLLAELERLRADLHTIGEDLTGEQGKAASWLDVATGRAANVSSVLASAAPAQPAGAVLDGLRALSEAFAQTACCASCTTPVDCYQGKPCRLEPAGSGSGLVDHEFKSHPDVFWPAARGEKTFEYRRDDRGGYEVGQTVRLRCYDPTRGYHDTAPLDRRITNILRGGEFELPMGYCILSLAPLSTHPAGQSAGSGAWSEHSPQEIVRRTRCMADETRDAVVWRDCCDLILERLGKPAPDSTRTGAAETEENWRADPSADERWCAGVDYAQEQLCHVLGVDPSDVNWDAATETLDGDMQAVICTILAAWGGDDWQALAARPEAPSDAGWRDISTAAPEAQGADDLADRLRREIGEIRTMAADPENKAAFCELTVVADNLEALLPAPPSSGQGGR
ncbi:UNVERIFIED_CONTAM: DUF3850 domain-containing protein [Methylobacteriaceae bacterium AG10]|nr:DUF3850 domain-containing protein [Methylobacteriaceae bacterium AG10]